jgi:hypothetical protein
LFDEVSQFVDSAIGVGFALISIRKQCEAAPYGTRRVITQQPGKQLILFDF